MQTLLTAHASGQTRKPSLKILKEASYLAFADCFNGFVWSLDAYRKYIVVNEALKKKITGILDRNVTCGDPVCHILETPQGRTSWDEWYDRGFAGEEQRFVEQFMLDGKPVHFEIGIHPVCDEQNVIALSCFARDVTAEIATHRKSELKFRSLIENSTDMIFMADETGNFVYGSPSVQKFLGYEEKDYVGRFCLQLVDAGSHVTAQSLLGNVLKYPGKVITFYLSLVHKNGTEIPVEGMATNMLHVPGVNALVANFRDISERKKAERLLRESEDLYRNLFNSSPLPIWVCDTASLRFLEVNEAAIQLYGYNRKEFMKMTIFGIEPVQEHENLKQRLTTISNRNDRIQRNHLNKNREEIFLELLVHKINYKGQEAYLMLANDLTETIRLQNKHIEEKLLLQQEIIKASIEATEKERELIGRELHDNVTQLLTTAKLCLSCASDNFDGPGMIRRGMNSIQAAIEEIRTLSKSMIQAYDHEIGLQWCIEDLADSIRASDRYQVRLDFALADEYRLEDKLKVTVFRIVQEQLNNIMRHANASDIHISLRMHGGVLDLVIADDGRGFRTQEKRKGIGITNIINRAALFNGRVRIDSSPGNGCRMHVQFPVK